MRILRSATYRRMPWKNGGGETREIAVFPEGAGMDDFGWRISMAHVAQDGPFSLFPGIDRTLLVLDGMGIKLDIAGQVPVHLDKDTGPFSFSADKTTYSRLCDGPIADLNVMTRRGFFTHDVSIITLETESEQPFTLRIGAVFCLHKNVIFITDKKSNHLYPSDSVVRAVDTPQQFRLRGEGTVVLVRIYPCNE